MKSRGGGEPQTPCLLLCATNIFDHQPPLDSCDVDRVDVLFLLVKQHVYMCHDLMKKCKKKTQNFIFQHPLKTPSLSNSCCIKFTILSDGPKTLQEVVLVLKNGVNSTTVKVPPCWWSSRTGIFNSFGIGAGSWNWGKIRGRRIWVINYGNKEITTTYWRSQYNLFCKCRTAYDHCDAVRHIGPRHCYIQMAIQRWKIRDTDN